MQESDTTARTNARAVLNTSASGYAWNANYSVLQVQEGKTAPTLWTLEKINVDQIAAGDPYREQKLRFGYYISSSASGKYLTFSSDALPLTEAPSDVFYVVPSLVNGGYRYRFSRDDGLTINMGGETVETNRFGAYKGNDPKPVGHERFLLAELEGYKRSVQAVGENGEALFYKDGSVVFLAKFTDLAGAYARLGGYYTARTPPTASSIPAPSTFSLWRSNTP